MAKLYRNASTDEYYTETAMDGQFVTLHIHPDGKDYLQQQGVQEDSRIPAEMLAVMEENQWLSPRDDDAAVPQPSIANESETHASASDARVTSGEPLPSVKLEPRPWMEQENVAHIRGETAPTAEDTGQSERKFSSTPADRANAHPLMHPEDTAFSRNLWFWLLIAAVVVLVVWGLFEVFLS